MQGMAERVKLGVPPGYQFAIEPDDAVTVVERDGIHETFFHKW
jgi:hypothetical protein